MSFDGQSNKRQQRQDSSMSNNFWEEQLSDDGSKDEADKSSRKRIDSTERNVKINVSLDDFPVDNWDSDNDGQEIVYWYNNNRMAEDEKSLEFFKLGSGVQSIHSRSQAQKLLDFTIHTLEQEGCTVWDKPQQTIEIQMFTPCSESPWGHIPIFKICSYTKNPNISLTLIS